MFYVVCEAMVCEGRATREAAEQLLSDIGDCCPHPHLILQSDSKPRLVPDGDDTDVDFMDTWADELV